MQQTTNCKTGCSHIDDYADAILSGRTPSDEITQRCVRYHLRRLQEPGVYIDIAKTERAKELIEKYFGFTLFPWELYVLALVHVYIDHGKRVLFNKYFLLMGTGNGKNGFISGLTWYFTTPDHGVKGYNVDIVANSEEQAKLSFNEIYNMIEDHWPKLKGQYYRSKTNIENRKTRSYIQYNTSNAATKAGKRTACLIFDEVFAYQDYSLINEFIASFGKRPHSRLFMITSQGLVREGVLDQELKIVEDVLNGENDTIGLCPLVYRVSSEEEVLDRGCWEKANPSLPYLESLQTMLEQQFATIRYNSEQEEAFYTKRMSWPKQGREMIVATHDELMTASGPIDVDLTGMECVAGLDYALLSDMASVGLLFRVDDKRYWIQHSWICRESADWPRIKAPLDEWQDRGDLTIVDGPQIDPFLIADWLTEQMTKYSIRTLAIDNARYALMREVLEQIGFNYDRKIGNVKLVRPLQIASVSPVIESWFRTGAIRWGDVPLMRWATNNTKKVRMRAESASRNYKYDKIEPRSRKTDPFMALVHAATVDEDLQPTTSSWALELPVLTW